MKIFEKLKTGYKYINNEISLEDLINNLNINDYYQNNKINKNEIKNPNIKEILSNLRRMPLSQRIFFYKSEKIVIKGIVLNKNNLNFFEYLLFCCIDNFDLKFQMIKLIYIIFL